MTKWIDETPGARVWTEIGAQFTGEGDRPAVERAIVGLYWREPADGVMSGPFSPMHSLQAFSRAAIPQDAPVTRYAYNGEDDALEYPDGPERATYGLLGLEAQFSNGSLRVYVLDTGLSSVPLAYDFMPTGEVWPAGAQPRTPGIEGRTIMVDGETGQVVRPQRPVQD